MAKREDVQTSIWTEADDFIDLSPDAKLLYLWSFTNEHVNMAGLYRIARRVMQQETTLPAKRFERALTECSEARFLVYRDGVLWVRTRAKHLWSKHPNFGRSIAKDVEKLGDHPLVREFLLTYGKSPWLSEHLAGFAIPEPKTEDPTDSLAKSHRDFLSNSNSSSKGSTAPLQGEVDMPPDLAPFVAPVKSVLSQVAAAKDGAVAPTQAAIANVLRRFPRKDFVPLAEDYAHWALHGRGAGKPAKDVVRAYRNWIEKEPDVLRKTTPGGARVDRTDDRLAEARL